MITVELRDDSVLIRVTKAHVDLDAGRQMREVMLEAAEHVHKPITVDLSGVTYLNSAFIGALLSFDGSIRKEGGQLTIMGASNEVMDIFRMLRLEEYFRFD